MSTAASNNFHETVHFDLAETHYGTDYTRPGLQGFLIPGKRGRLLSTFFAAGGPGPHPTILMFHGIPGVERNLDLAQHFRRRGFHVMTFHYSGSWGSDGVYSIANDLEDAETVLDYVLNAKGLNIDHSRIYAVGHSLGGFVCAHLAARRSEIKAGVLLMPYDVGQAASLKAENPDAYQSMVDLLTDAAGWLNTDAKALIPEAEENADAFLFAPLAPKLAKKPILLVTGDLDIEVPDAVFCAPLRRAILAAGGKLLEHESYPTDHCFSDYRLTVAGRIVAFFESNPLL